MTTNSEDDLFDAGDLSSDNAAEEQAAADYDEAASSGSNEGEIKDATIGAANALDSVIGENSEGADES
jgi:hypothetical protein